MFYLKYRPQKFSEFIEPNPAAKALANQVKNDRISHAYLFVGSRGTGKTTAARILAKAANCLNLDKSGDPCGECQNCIAIKGGSHMDLIEIDAASNRGIDDIRSLRDRVNLAPSQGSTKVYIIDEVHMLTTEAFNALLKTLEEPPNHAMFVLCTTEPSKVLDTIKSRCQIFNFKRASIDQLMNKLLMISEEEGVEVPASTLRRIAKASFGGYRDAETMLQQVIQGGFEADSLVGGSSYDEYIQFVNFLIDADAASGLNYLEKKYSQGTDMQSWLVHLLDYLKSLLFIKSGADGISDEVTDDIHSEMQIQADALSVADLVHATGKFLEAYDQTGKSGVNVLPLELVVADMCSLWGNDFERSSDGGDGGGNGEISVKNREKGKTKKSKSAGNKSDSSEKNKTKNSKKNEEVTTVLGDDKSEDGKEIPSIDEIKNSWKKVLQASTKHNNSVRALLKTASPVDVQGSLVILEVHFAFHKDRLECTKNRKIVEKVLSEIFSCSLGFSCRVKEESTPNKRKRETGNLTDLNLVVPGKSGTQMDMDESLLEVFDGGLPL